MAVNNSDGHVYLLTSPRCQYIKIGGTDHPPLKRLREINASEPYKSLGPWTLQDFRQVIGWRRVEYTLHYTFRSQRVTTIEGQKELFDIPVALASEYLDQLDTSVIVKKPVIDRMFQDIELARFLEQLFRTTAILNWTDLQGAWTFTLFPSTGKGRYYTLSIGRHEVAFSTLPIKTQLPVHMIYMDKLVQDFEEPTTWLKEMGGSFSDEHYDSAMEHSTGVFFSGTFNDATTFLQLKGVRRAILAYWNEALVQLQEENSLSLFARFHNWNAVADLRKRVLNGLGNPS
jgi:hypothetical protein